MRDKYRLRIAKSDRGWRRSYGVTSDMEPEAKNFSRSKFSFDLIIKIINLIRSDSTLYNVSLHELSLVLVPLSNRHVQHASSACIHDPNQDGCDQ